MTDTPESKAVPAPAARNWDVYAAIVASLVGLLALLVSAYTANIQRQQVRAQVWPRLEVSRSPDRREMVVANVGIGPARVRAVSVKLDGRALKSWDEVMHALGHPTGYGVSQLSHRVFAPGQRIQVINGWDNEEGRRAFKHVFVESEARLDVLICYCSVLDQCWMAGGLKSWGIDDDREIDDCPIAAADRFEQ
jgi:hypothetical protein